MMAILDDIALGQKIYSIDKASLMSDISGVAAHLYRDIISLALRRLEAIWRDGNRQAKAGVPLGDFYLSDVAQLDMFSQQLLRASTDALMAATDQINRSGLSKVWFAGLSTDNGW